MNWNHYESWLSNLLLTEIPFEVECPTLSQLVFDSRNIKRGDWFFALKGERLDGHNFIEEVIQKGASGVFVGKDYTKKIPISSIRVKDTMTAYHSIAHGWRKLLPDSLNIISLTGSVGKTTVKNLLLKMLSPFEKTYASPGNKNTHFSVPQCLFELNSSYKYAILEFGARHPGDIKTLTKMTEPKISLCLNAKSSHLEIFKSLEALQDTKLQILRDAPESSICIVLRDDETLYEKAQKLNRDLLSFGFHEKADIRILECKQEKSGALIRLEVEGLEHSTHLPFYHESHAFNVAAALSVAYALKLPLEESLKNLESFSGLEGRYQVLKLKSGLSLVDDTYNASPESMKAGLQSFHKTFAQQKKILILGDMKELGSISKESHINIAHECVSIDPIKLITVGTETLALKEKALELGMNKDEVYHFENVEKLLPELTKLINGAESIYIKGSLSMNLKKIVQTLTNT